MGQCLIAASIGGLTNSLIFAFFTSVLSIISSILRHFIDRSGDGMQSVQYFVFTECQGIELTSKQRRNILNKKGLRRYLGIGLARVFGIDIKRIEVGHSTLTQCGLFTRIIQNIDDSELLSLSPKEYISNKLVKKTEEISALFTKHFGLTEMNEFECLYYLDPFKKLQIGASLHGDLHSEIEKILSENEIKRGLLI